MKTNKIFSLLIFSALSLSLHAAVYYASPNGSGDGKSYDTPTTFSKGIKLLSNAGDTLYLLSGQYDLPNTQIGNLNGSADKHIVISGYDGINEEGSYDAILDFRTVAYGTRGLQIRNTCTYLHIKNLTLRYSGKNNLYNEGSYCLFENLDIYGSGDTGCQMKVGGYNTIKNVDSHDNFDYEQMRTDGSGNSVADFGGNADGFADKQHNGAPNHYIGCRAWNNSDDGWDFFQRVNDSYSGYTILENCICYKNGPISYDMTNHPRYQTDKAWFDKMVGTSMTDRFGKTITITLKEYPNIGNGNGFKLGGDQTNHNVMIHHSLSVANTVKGFDQNSNAGTMYVYNNTGVQNGTDYGFYNTNCGTLYLRNNISFESQNKNTTSVKTVVKNDYNTWNSGFGCSADDFLSTDSTGLLSARESDGSLPELAFMRLKEGSKLIDAGVEVGLAYSGDAPDLGCYEYSSGEYKLPATLTLTNGSLQQALRLGNSLTPVVLTWGGGAESISYGELPEGIVATEDTDSQTLTVSGTPTTIGSYSITFSTEGGVGKKTLTLTLIVKKAVSGYQVAYVTLPGNAADQLILQSLNADDDLDVTLFDATAAVDVSQADLIVISPVPASNAAGLTALKAIEKPTLLLKPFMLKSSVWNWGNSANTQEHSIKVTSTTHPIFTGISLGDDNTFELFGDGSGNAVTVINGWTNSSITSLATPVSAEGDNIAEAKKGTSMNGTIIKADFLMIGVSEYNTAYLTEAGCRLIDNACRYLLGLEITSEATDAGNAFSIDYSLTGNELHLHQCKNATLYTLLGQTVCTTGNGVISVSQLPAGIYLLKSNNGCCKVRIP